MSDLIVVTYQDKYRAEEVMVTLRRLQVEHLVDLQDACSVTKGRDGTIRLHQAVNLTARGAMRGGFWGMLIGMLFHNPIGGGLFGAGVGALSGSTPDHGLDDDFMRTLGQQMGRDTSAIFILVRKITLDKVQAELSKFGGTILQTSFTCDVEAKWQAALSGRDGSVPIAA